MAYAAMIQVVIDPGSDREHRNSILNQFVVPEVKGLPGFQTGMWMNNGRGTATCVVLFDTEEHARSAIPPMTPEGGPPVLGSDVVEVEILA